MIKVENWREELGKRGLTLAELERRSGYSSTYISKIFDGQQAAPLSTIEKIIGFLKECPWCHRAWPTDLKIDGEDGHPFQIEETHPTKK